ncbi:MAG: hypothetical protein ACH34X_06575 [Thiolinea sp.]
MRHVYYLVNIKQFIFKMLILITLTSLSSLAQADPKLISTVGQSSLINEVLDIAIDSLGNNYIFEYEYLKYSSEPKAIIVKKINNEGLLISQSRVNDRYLYSPVINKKNEFYTINYKPDGLIIKKWSATWDLILKWKIPLRSYDYSAKLVIDSKNQVYVKLKHSIKIYNENGVFIRAIKGYFHKKSLTIISPFISLSHISINKKDNLVISESRTYNSSVILSINNNGQLLRPILKRNQEFNVVANDENNNIYVSMYNCGCIHKFSQTGLMPKILSKKGSEKGQLYSPTIIKFDNVGNLIIADSGNYRIQKFNSAFQAAWTYGDQLGYLKYSTGHVVDSQGNIYVIDRGHHRIQKFSSNGSALKAWGSYGLKNGQFIYPETIKIDLADNIYVQDNYKARIQTFSNDGVYLGEYKNKLPNFDKNGNAYHLITKKNPNTQATSSYLQKIKPDGRIQEFSLRYLDSNPCTGSVAFDSQANIYILSCSYEDNYDENSSRTLMFSHTIYLYKINSETGSIVKKTLLDYGEGSPPTYDIVIDERDLLYVKGNSFNNFTFVSNFVLNTDFELIGSLKNLSYYFIYTINNKLYLKEDFYEDVIQVYETPSNLKAPLFTSIDKLASQGELELKWQDRTDNETGFKLQRCTGESCSNFSTIALLNPNTSSVKLLKSADFKLGSIYRFRLTALKDEEESLSAADREVAFNPY